MKCQKCGANEANTHFVQNVNGKSTELWLCTDCAEELGIGGMFSDFGGFGTFNPFSAFETMLGGLFGGFGSMKPSLGFKSSGTLKAPDRCPLCGSTFDDMAKRGKAGCPECYEHFADQLLPSIERLHGTRSHTGSHPDRNTKSSGRDPIIQPDNPGVSKLAELRRQLNEAVAAEEYEKAAQIHNQIKKLEA